MKIKSLLQENLEINENELSSFIGDDQATKEIMNSFALAFKGLKLLESDITENTALFKYTDNLSTLAVKIRKVGDKFNSSASVKTNIDVVNKKTDSDSTYFHYAWIPLDAKGLASHYDSAAHVLADHMSKFVDWYFDIAGVHGKLKLIRIEESTTEFTFYAVGGKFSNSGDPEKITSEVFKK